MTITRSPFRLRYHFGMVTGMGFDNDYFDYFDAITVNGER